MALFGVFVVEGLMLLYFAPSESLVPAGIFLLADSSVEVVAVVLVAVVGATVGQTLLFGLARRGGREYLLQRSWFRVSQETLTKFDGWFDRWGPLAISLSNTLPFTRGMLTVPAGFTTMRTRTFIALSALGTLAFQGLLALVTLGLLDLV